MKMRAIRTKPEDEAFYQALCRVLGNEGKDMDALVCLAITAQFLGRLIAVQDQRKYTSLSIMAIVSQNIEDGNAEMIKDFMNLKGSA